MSRDLTPGGILALDLSTRTGWAYGHASARLTRPAAFGTWELGTSRVALAAPWATLLDQLADTCQVMRPSLIVMEAPLPPRSQTNARVARLLFGLCAVTELFAYRWSIECREQDAVTVRKGLIGKARPEKDEIVSWCQARGLADLTDHNAADAVTLWFFSAALRS
jgi:Holliday junction resolvasome RuvABC endonuclease subunit